MKILSISTEFPNASEPGKGLFVRARLRAMASYADVTVIAPVAMLDYANPQNRLLAAFAIPRERVDNGMQVKHVRWIYPPFGGIANAWFLFGRLLWPVMRLRASRSCDLIDAHFAHPEGIAAALLGQVLRIPFLVTIRGSELRYQRHKWKRHWIGWALRRADRVIAVSDGLRELAIGLGVAADRATVIPNGTDASIFFPRDRSVCRVTQGIPAGERVILSAGDLAELKGHHRVIQATKTLHSQNIPVRLLIAGGVGRSGRYASTLRRQVELDHLEDRVRFMGEVTQNELAELMCAADVFCLASSSEGWPNVVNEALACGTPVVATDVGAVRTMIPSREYGVVVPVDDVGALTGALATALRNDWDRQMIAAWGQSRSWNQVAIEVLDEVRKAIR